MPKLFSSHGLVKKEFQFFSIPICPDILADKGYPKVSAKCLLDGSKQTSQERVGIELTSNANDLESIKKAITSGFFPHSARLQTNGSYWTVKPPQATHIHPSSGCSE